MKNETDHCFCWGNGMESLFFCSLTGWPGRLTTFPSAEPWYVGIDRTIELNESNGWVRIFSYHDSARTRNYRWVCMPFTKDTCLPYSWKDR